MWRATVMLLCVLMVIFVGWKMQDMDNLEDALSYMCGFVDGQRDIMAQWEPLVESVLGPRPVEVRSENLRKRCVAVRDRVEKYKAGVDG